MANFMSSANIQASDLIYGPYFIDLGYWDGKLGNKSINKCIKRDIEYMLIS